MMGRSRLHHPKSWRQRSLPQNIQSSQPMTHWIGKPSPRRFIMGRCQVQQGGIPIVLCCYSQILVSRSWHFKPSVFSMGKNWQIPLETTILFPPMCTTSPRLMKHLWLRISEGNQRLRSSDVTVDCPTTFCRHLVLVQSNNYITTTIVFEPRQCFWLINSKRSWIIRKTSQKPYSSTHYANAKSAPQHESVTMSP